MIGLFEINIFLLTLAALAVATLIGIKKGHLLLYLSMMLGVLIVGGIIYISIAFLAFRWRPSFPKCKKGKCHGVGYYHYLGKEGYAKKYRCECGDEYLLFRNGDLKIIEDGKTRSFMKHSRFGRWRAISEIN